MSSAEALRRIPLGNAIMIEAIAEDPTVAVSIALQELSENYGDSITNKSASIHNRQRIPTTNGTGRRPPTRP